MKKKTIALLLAVVMLFGTVVGGTLAYLLDSKTVTNTFTVGQVKIKVDEADVNADGTPVDGAARVEDGNKYHLIPGREYTKDPTLTVLAGSEEAYVRMILTINCWNELSGLLGDKSDIFTDVIKGYNPANWPCVATTEDKDANTVTFEFRYKTTVENKGTEDKALEELFTGFVVPGEFDNEDIKKLENLEIKVEGQAIQAAGFADETGENGLVIKTAEDAAWAAFDDQVKPDAPTEENP